MPSTQSSFMKSTGLSPVMSMAQKAPRPIHMMREIHIEIFSSVRYMRSAKSVGVSWKAWSVDRIS